MARHSGASGKHQAHADQKQKHADDQRPEPEPQRVVVENGSEDVEPIQVEKKVIYEHQANRHTAYCVDTCNPLPCRHPPRTLAGAPLGVRPSPLRGFCPALRHGPTVHATRYAPVPSARPIIERAVAMALLRSVSSPSRGRICASIRASPLAVMATV